MVAGARVCRERSGSCPRKPFPTARQVHRGAAAKGMRCGASEFLVPDRLPKSILAEPRPGSRVVSLAGSSRGDHLTTVSIL